MPGLPAGIYEFVAHTNELQYPGPDRRRGQLLDDTAVPGEGTKDFIVNFDIQPSRSTSPAWRWRAPTAPTVRRPIGGPQSYFELPPAGGTNTRDNVSAPPTPS